MRISLAVTLESRDGGVTKDPKVLNGIAEVKGEGDAAQLFLRKRPGTSDLGSVKSGTAQLLYNWNGVNAIIADYMNRAPISTISSAPVQTNLTPANAGLQMTAAATNNTAGTPRLMFKNRTQGWYMNRVGTIASITYGGNMGAGTQTITLLTRSGGTATATISEDVFNVGDSVTIAGASDAAYNGTKTITAVTVGSTTPAQDVDISSLTRAGTVATAVAASHGLTNGSSYTISGANESAYNGSKAVTVIDSNTFTYTVTVTPAAAVTWNSGDKDADITLSGGDLVASSSVSGATGAVRASAGKSSGKWYWEVTVTSMYLPSASGFRVGIAAGSGTFGVTNRELGDGSTANQAIGYSSPGVIYNGGSGAGASAAYTTGHIIGVALDADSGVIYFYKNGGLVGQLSISTGVTWYPAFSSNIVSGYSGTNSATVNFGASVFAYSAPSGFSALQVDDPQTPATGSPKVTKPGVTVNPTFSYAVAGTPATPDGGANKTAQGNGGTVPGIAYIDGYFAVMDTNGVIWNSALDDPTTWPATTYTTAQSLSGAGRAVGMSLNYLIAFKEWSTEPFYRNPSNASGSVFTAVPNGFTRVGCASGDSVAEVAGSLMWISQTKEEGRGVHMMRGLEQQKVSSPDVDRILEADSLSTVYAYGIEEDGHPLYVLTLVGSTITLIYDVKSGMWYQWSSLTAGSARNVYSITRSGRIVTVKTLTAHGLSDGDPVSISGTPYNEYNNIFQALYVSPTVFTIDVGSLPTTPTLSPSYATWNPADKGADVTLAAGNLAASMTSVACMVRATVGMSAGKWYWEVRITATTSTTPIIGIATASANTGSFLGGDRYGFGFNAGDALRFSDYLATLVVFGYGSTCAVNDIVGVALDLDNGTLTFYKNGVSLGTAFTDLNAGTYYPAVSGLTADTCSVVANFGASAFAYSAPDGYTAGVIASVSPTVTATPYSESYFKYTKGMSLSGSTYLLDTSGHIYKMQASVHRDAGSPINWFARTARIDGGSLAIKKLASVAVVGDNVADLAALRWSDDDTETMSSYRLVDLALEYPVTNKCGAFRRRTIEFRHVGNTAPVIQGLELEVS